MVYDLLAYVEMPRRLVVELVRDGTELHQRQAESSSESGRCSLTGPVCSACQAAASEIHTQEISPGN